MTETITCECGAIVRGNSKINAQANLKLHKNSRKHKELMKLKNNQQDALNKENKGSGPRDEGAANE